MKMLTIIPVEKPKRFEDVAFTQDEYRAAAKRGPVTVPAPTALEALKNGKGLYRIKPEEKTIAVEIKALKEPEDMTNQELFAEMASYGKPPRKQMARKAAVEFVSKLRQEAADLIVDDEDE